MSGEGSGLVRLTCWLGARSPRQRGVLAAASGALSVMAFAPYLACPILFVTLPMLVWLLDAAALQPELGPMQPRMRLRAIHRQYAALRMAAVGWCFGFGFFLAGLFWIGEAFLVEAETFAVLMPFAVTLMPAGLALFWGAAAALASWLWARGLIRVLTLAITLSAAEWLRGHVLTGFPWNVIGYALTAPLPMMQSAALIGIYGLTLIAIVVFTTPLVALADASRSRRWRYGAALLALMPLPMMSVFGALRLAGHEPPQASDLRVRLVQPSVPQREKWRPENQARIFSEHISLSLRTAEGLEDGAAGIGLIVWPEAAMPFLPLHTPRALEEIARFLPPSTRLVSGALRLEEARSDAPGSPRQVFNSLLVFGGQGQLEASYDKVHLVPFGEYLPFQSTLESMGLEQLTRLRGGFASGSTPRPLLALPGLPKLGPLICYEAIFPGAIVQGDERPAALINVTNDGWFGNTTGPRQHFHQSRVRAVEEGLPLLRVANNGISGIIDAKGRVLDRLGMNVKGVIDSTIPGALPPPLYARVGDWTFALMLAAASALLAGLMCRERRRRS